MKLVYVFAVFTLKALLISFRPCKAFHLGHNGAVASNSWSSPKLTSPRLRFYKAFQKTFPIPSESRKDKTHLYGSPAQEAASLFGNMNLPASIIAGAIVPLGFLAPLEVESEPGENIWEQRVRRMYQALSVITLSTELIAVMWATVACNQLTENTFAPADTVWHFIQRDFELEWTAVNTHFVIGMLGFLGMIGSRTYFCAKKGLLGGSTGGVVLSSLALMVSIVNRGVAAGGGGDKRFGGTIFSLAQRYTTLLLLRALSLKTFGILEVLSVTGLVVSLSGAAAGIWKGTRDSPGKEETEGAD